MIIFERSRNLHVFELFPTSLLHWFFFFTSDVSRAFVTYNEKYPNFIQTSCSFAKKMILILLISGLFERKHTCMHAIILLKFVKSSSMDWIMFCWLLNTRSDCNLVLLYGLYVHVHLCLCIYFRL